jgi:hypothetical protein
MTHTAFGSTSATVNAPFKGPPQTGADGFSSEREAELRRVRQALLKAQHRLEAAQRKSDFESKLGAMGDIERYSNVLARLAGG